MSIQSEWLTIPEAAGYLKIARSTLYRWTQEGRLTLYRLGGQTVRIRKNDLEALAQPVLSQQFSQELGTLVASRSAIWDLVGIAEGPQDLAAEHDRYLAQAIESEEQ